MDEQEIIRRLRSGDQAAFRQVVGEHSSLVMNCAYKFLRNRESAEDITQEVFLEVFESIHSFRGDAQLSTWIYRIAVTKSINLIKRQNRKKRFAWLVPVSDEHNPVDHLPSGDESDPAKSLERKERADRVAGALAKLPDNQKIAYTLSKVEGMKYDEIARVMNTTVPSVESLVHRAKGSLAERLSAYYQQQND
jgi:RNA polymerase sigma-70 factor, ECF subfamily